MGGLFAAPYLIDDNERLRKCKDYYDLIDKPKDEDELNELLWCKEIECRKKNITSSDNCVPLWDTLMCWPETPPGVLAKEFCPPYYFWDLANASVYATKQCFQNGTWDSWGNYTACYAEDEIGPSIYPPFPGPESDEYIYWTKTFSAIGYVVSLTTLAAAFIILASFKRLRCPRNVLHMHLFVSFILRAGMRFVKDEVYMETTHTFVPQGTWFCKLVICIWQYAIISNYSWILMEGLYLHNLIFLALFTDTSAITIYIILGWGLPLGFVLPWAILRALYDDEACWTLHKERHFKIFLDLPIIASTVINFFLFVNIVRVLLLKLTASISEENRRFRYRRWAKSTLVLVPLFGAHYAILSVMTLIDNQNVEKVWLFCDQLFGSFQGTFVAILYCFLNAEVQAEITKLWVGMDLCGWRNTPHRFLGMNGSRIISRKSRPSTAGESCMTSFISTSAQCDGNYRRKTIPSITPVLRGRGEDVFHILDIYKGFRGIGERSDEAGETPGGAVKGTYL